VTTAFAIVTAEDREHGIPVSCEHCPIARAATRAAKAITGRPLLATVSNLIRITFYDTTGPAGYGFGHVDVPLTPEARDFMDRFDRSMLLPEFLSFPIEIPENLPPPNRRLVT
jgi:hypothetical protein